MEGMDLRIAPLPAGPVGHPVSMFNGLGDSISEQSERKEEAAQLVAFLASDEAQRVIGERAPFFPSTDAGTRGRDRQLRRRRAGRHPVHRSGGQW